MPFRARGRARAGFYPSHGEVRHWGRRAGKGRRPRWGRRSAPRGHARPPEEGLCLCRAVRRLLLPLGRGSWSRQLDAVSGQGRKGQRENVALRPPRRLDWVPGFPSFPSCAEDRVWVRAFSWPGRSPALGDAGVWCLC